MGDQYLASIQLFGGSFAPRYFAYCGGQLMPISDNTALYALLGTSFGGDGRTTYGIPDLRGRVACGTSQGPGLTDRNIGDRFGAECYQMTIAQMPTHTHSIATLKGASTKMNATVNVNSDVGITASPMDAYLATQVLTINRDTYNPLGYGSSADTTMATDAVQVDLAGISSILGATATGEGSHFPVTQPTTAITYVICISGIFPSRS